MKKYKEPIFTIEMYYYVDFIEQKLHDFNWRTNNEYALQVSEIIYSYLHSSDDVFNIELDYDEGPNNDPWWNYEKDEHCTTTCIRQIIIDMIKEFDLKDDRKFL